MFYELIEWTYSHSRQRDRPPPLQTCHNNSPTIAQHVTVLLTLSLQLVLVQVCSRSDKHCSVEHPSMSLSVGTGELSVAVYCQFQNIHITYVFVLFDMFKTGYCCIYCLSCIYKLLKNLLACIFLLNVCLQIY